MKTICLFLSMLFSTFVNAQDLASLYYAQPKQVGSDPLIMPIYGDEGMLLFQIGSERIYYLRKGNIFADTLEFATKKTEQILTTFWVDAEMVSVNSFYKGGIYSIKEGSFTKVVEQEFDRKLKKNLAKELNLNDKISTINLIAKGEFVIMTSSEIVYVDGQYNRKIRIDSIPFINSFQRNRVFGNNLFTVISSDLMIWDQFRNRLYHFDRNKKSGRVLEPMALRSRDGVNSFFHDKATQLNYIWRWSPSDQSGDLHLFNVDKETSELVADSLEGVIRGLYGGNLYITEEFDGTVGHFLVPLDQSRQELNLLKEVLINEN